MAVTETSHTADGSLTQFAFNFPYLKSTDIEVQVDGAVESTSNWSLANATTVQFNSAPDNGKKIKILRQTNVDSLTATFYAGSSIKSEDLNDNYTQNLYKTQEIGNRSFQNTGGSMTGDLSLGENVDLIFEGTAANEHETTLKVANPSQDNTITLPDVTGTVITTGDTGTVTSTMINDATIVNGDIANTTITGGKLVNDTITATQIAADAVTASELADDAVDTNAILNDAVTYAKVQNVSATDRVLGRDSAGAGVIEEIAPTALRTMLNVEDGATADQSNAEIRAAVEAASDSNVFTDADHTKLNAIESSADVTDATNVDAAGAVMNSDTSTASMSFVVDEDDFSSDSATKVPTQQSTKAYIASYGTSAHQPLDADLTTLATMQSDTASVLAGTTALTSTLTELNMLDGKSIVTSISGSSTDVQLPTAKAVDDRVTALVTDVGGFRPIANETSFPATNPDPDDDAGTIVSVKALASNLTSNGSGVATIANGAGTGNTVTINGMANSDTIEAGKGILVETTSTLHTYTFHRETLAPADVTAAKSAVDDFGDRYQVASSAPSSHPDSSALLEGDLWFDTSANKMKVYDGSNYAVVTSVGDYRLLTIEDTDGSAFDGANQTFNLKDGGSAANVTSAGQLIVSVNGVIQKPNAGTSAPAEGFALVDSDTIIFSNAPGAGASVFVTLIGSATGVNTPATNSIVEGMIQVNQVSEEKLKISNSGSNGQFLSKQSGDSGGLTWATVTDTNTNILAGGTITGDVIFDNATHAGDDLTWDMSDKALEFDDDVKAVFGDGGDLTIRHDGSNSFIDEAGDGDLLLTATAGSIQLKKNTGDKMLQANVDGSIELYHANTKELETKSGGVKLFGHSESYTYGLTSAAQVTIDFSLANHFTCTMGHTIAFQNPTTESVGQSGTITLTQPNSGSTFTASWQSQFLWTGGTAPSLTQTNDAVDRIDYVVVAADKIHCVASLDVKSS